MWRDACGAVGEARALIVVVGFSRRGEAERTAVVRRETTVRRGSWLTGAAVLSGGEALFRVNQPLNEALVKSM